MLGEFGLKNLSEIPPPQISEYFQEINELQCVAIGFALLFTVAVITLAGLHLYFVIRYVSHPSMQTDLYWIVFLCPIVSICNSVGICAPKTAAFLYSVGIVYFLLCIFVLVTLMTTLYGSRTAMCHKLEEKGVELNPRVFPLGCCLICLPNIKPTAKNIRMLEWCVFQSPIIRVVIEIVSIAVYFEYETKQNWFFTPANLISFISMIISSYSSYILMPAGCKQLSQYRFLAMFRMVDWAQFIYNVQKHVLEAIVLLKIFGKDTTGPFGSTTVIQFWASFLATFEMAVLSFMATYFFRPSKAAFFDIYITSQRQIPTPYTPSPNPFACFPVLDATQEDEFEQISPLDSKASKEKTSKPEKERNSKVLIAEKEKRKEQKILASSIISVEKQTKSKEQEIQLQPQQQQPKLHHYQNSPANGNDKTKTPATTLTPLNPTSIIDPNSTTNVEIFPVEPTQEITDKIL
uniref:Organic solute transporter alpha-like protein n=1 Tax=Panagrolaimus sp. PS1159 TaxID=55785 RepID=A0AC35FR15_9BILA